MHRRLEPALLLAGAARNSCGVVEASIEQVVVRAVFVNECAD